MTFRRTLLAAALLLPLPALAQDVPAPTPTPTPKPATQKVAIDTSFGRIVLELETERAPITARNFLRYADQKRLDGIAFYRTVKVADKFGFIQFGIDNDPKRILPPIKHEPTTQTGVKHVNGAISTARLAPGTARGEFTISVGDQPSLDADPSKPGDNLGYAAFGKVIDGMEVVWKILDAPTSPTAGEGVMKGQMLSPRIRILKVSRIP
ncbi:peptidyl-prolyl cis-trans isomerase A (cyclophilin A) [Sphingomonas sp. BE123]|jgi:peptidyl-prolyl cis-trans isomerase A (cyclophilin A)|uniref:peptidylprolyl isomerase n=1 Tax=Sphingomonas sp. BE123 TaxID=2817842 RepID=UPI00286228B9|nr:peptidylprolyl isomerase [Sphingomonas sp. BE123]MDR6851199.1 peptidyl-prolyl cis-trans isomerase A (cyclophilin A) [Sphingomonas sp. BE123]